MKSTARQIVLYRMTMLLYGRHQVAFDRMMLSPTDQNIAATSTASATYRQFVRKHNLGRHRL